jgi:hypothetical protein
MVIDRCLLGGVLAGRVFSLTAGPTFGCLSFLIMESLMVKGGTAVNYSPSLVGFGPEPPSTSLSMSFVSASGEVDWRSGRPYKRGHREQPWRGLAWDEINKTQPSPVQP